VLAPRRSTFRWELELEPLWESEVGDGDGDGTARETGEATDNAPAGTGAGPKLAHISLFQSLY
jgi:hypothetical protein